MQRKRVAIQKAYLLACVNARFEDLHKDNLNTDGI